MMIFGHSVPDRLSACKAEKGGIAVAMSTDDNAADDSIAGADGRIITMPGHYILMFCINDI